MNKRILTGILAASLALSVFTSCGNSDNQSSTGADSTASTGSSQTAEGGESTAESDLREKELVTLDVVTMASGKEESGIAMVQDAMNELLEEKLNCNVTLTFIPFGNYAEQTTLMLSSGEGADLLPVYMIPLPTCANAGQIIPLDELLDQYGAGIKEQIGDYIECGRVGDAIYGITTGRDLASTQGFCMKKDIADKYEIDYANITTLEQLEEALMKVKEGEPNMWPVAVSAGENIRNWGWDPLGDDMINLGVLADMAQEPTVVNLYETEQYKNLCETMYDWMQKGLIQADAVNTTETASTLMTAGTALPLVTSPT